LHTPLALATPTLLLAAFLVGCLNDSGSGKGPGEPPEENPPGQDSANLVSVWHNVGVAGFSAGTATTPSLVLGADGNPFVVFQDGANGNKATVMRWNGSTWAHVGSAGFSEGAVSTPSLALD